MEDILASIRRILAEDEPAPGATAPADGTIAPPAVKDDVLVLDASMLAPGAAAEPEAAAPAVIELPAAVSAAAPTPPPSAPPRVEPAPVARAARPSNSINFEDAVRAAFQPVIKQWLDTALPKMAERIVRTEVERIVGNAVR